MLRATLFALTLGLLLTLRGTPTAYVPVPARPTPDERIAAAMSFLTSRGVDLTGYSAHQLMVENSNPTLYLQGVLTPEGLVKRLGTESLPLFYWQVHVVKAGELRQYWVRVTVDGKAGAFITRLPEMEKGGAVSIDEARRLALAQIPSGVAADITAPATGTKPTTWREVERSTSVMPRRTDHRFVFARDLELPQGAASEHEAPAQERLSVSVQGRKVGGYRNYIKVPETFDTRMSVEDTNAEALYWLAVTADVILILAAVWTMLTLVTRSSAPAARAAFIVLAVLLATTANYTPITMAAEYAPEKPLHAFLLSNVIYLALLACIPAIVTYLMFSAGDALDAQSGERSRTETFKLWLSGHWADPRVRDAMATGLLMGFALGGGEAIFFFVGQTWGPVTLPVGPRWVNTMATPLPFLYPLSIAIGAAITEECAFRLFAIGWLKRLGLPRALVIALPALAWAFQHSREAVYPVWVRGSELVIAGLLISWFYQQTDLLSVICAHYLYDAVTFGWALLTCNDPVAVGGTVATIALIALPGALGLWTRWTTSPARSGP